MPKFESSDEEESPREAKLMKKLVDKPTKCSYCNDSAVAIVSGTTHPHEDAPIACLKCVFRQGISWRSTQPWKLVPTLQNNYPELGPEYFPVRDSSTWRKRGENGRLRRRSSVGRPAEVATEEAGDDNDDDDDDEEEDEDDEEEQTDNHHNKGPSSATSSPAANKSTAVGIGAEGANGSQEKRPSEAAEGPPVESTNQGESGGSENSGLSTKASKTTGPTPPKTTADPANTTGTPPKITVDGGTNEGKSGGSENSGLSTKASKTTGPTPPKTTVNVTNKDELGSLENPAGEPGKASNNTEPKTTLDTKVRERNGGGEGDRERTKKRSANSVVGPDEGKQKRTKTDDDEEKFRHNFIVETRQKFKRLANKAASENLDAARKQKKENPKETEGKSSSGRKVDSKKRKRTRKDNTATRKAATTRDKPAKETAKESSPGEIILAGWNAALEDLESESAKTLYSQKATDERRETVRSWLMEGSLEGIYVDSSLIMADNYFHHYLAGRRMVLGELFAFAYNLDLCDKNEWTREHKNLLSSIDPFPPLGVNAKFYLPYMDKGHTLVEAPYRDDSYGKLGDRLYAQSTYGLRSAVCLDEARNANHNPLMRRIGPLTEAQLETYRVPVEESLERTSGPHYEVDGVPVCIIRVGDEIVYKNPADEIVNKTVMDFSFQCIRAGPGYHDLIAIVDLYQFPFTLKSTFNGVTTSRKYNFGSKDYILVVKHDIERTKQLDKEMREKLTEEYRKAVDNHNALKPGEDEPMQFEAWESRKPKPLELPEPLGGSRQRNPNFMVFGEMPRPETGGIQRRDVIGAEEQLDGKDNPCCVFCKTHIDLPTLPRRAWDAIKPKSSCTSILDQQCMPAGAGGQNKPNQNRFWNELSYHAFDNDCTILWSHPIFAQRDYSSVSVTSLAQDFLSEALAGAYGKLPLEEFQQAFQDGDNARLVKVFSCIRGYLQCHSSKKDISKSGMARYCQDIFRSAYPYPVKTQKDIKKGKEELGWEDDWPDCGDLYRYVHRHVVETPYRDMARELALSVIDALIEHDWNSHSRDLSWPEIEKAMEGKSDEEKISQKAIRTWNIVGSVFESGLFFTSVYPLIEGIVPKGVGSVFSVNEKGVVTSCSTDKISPASLTLEHFEKLTNPLKSEAYIDELKTHLDRVMNENQRGALSHLNRQPAGKARISLLGFKHILTNHWRDRTQWAVRKVEFGSLDTSEALQLPGEATEDCRTCYEAVSD